MQEYIFLDVLNSTMKRIMGNCIGSDMFPSDKEKIPLKSLDGGEEDFEVPNISRPVKFHARDVKLKSREVYCLIPDKVEHCGLASSRRAAKDSCRGRRVKIVVSKQQLEQLVRSMKKIPCSRTATIQSLRRRKRYQKWRPSLATIPEL